MAWVTTSENWRTSHRSDGARLPSVKGRIMITNLLRRRAIRRSTQELRTMIRQAPSQSVRNDLMTIAARETTVRSRFSVAYTGPAVRTG